jgi:hypothetical protein
MTDKLKICKQCGHTNKFSKIAYGSVNYSEIIIEDNKGNFLETTDTEYGDYNDTDYEPYYCPECQSPEILEFEIPEYIEFISRHTLPDATWSEDELETANTKVKRELQAKFILGD